MAHNARIRAPGFWVALGVLDAAEMELVDAARYLSIHEGGGAWAITDNVTIGAAGAQTWHYTLPVVLDDLSGHVVESKSLTFDSGSSLVVNGAYTLHGAGSLTGVLTVGAGGQIVVTTGRQITINTGGKISVQGQVDLTGTSTIDVGASAKINVSGEVDVLFGGAISFTDGGVIKGIARLHATASWYFTNGSTTHVLGAFKFESGSTGSVESGATLTVKTSGAISLETGSDITNLGTYHCAGPEIMSGNGYRAWRSVRADATDTDQTFDPREVDEVVIPIAIDAGSTYGILTDADIPNGVRITFRREGNTDPNGVSIRANGIDYFVFHGTVQTKSASVTFIKELGAYRIDDYCFYSTSQAEPLR